MADTPIRLYWWNKSANFGDAISRRIVEHVSGRAVEWAEAGEAELFALGSIMRTVARSHKAPRAHKVHVWGAGMLKPVGRSFLGHVRVAAVRGPETARILRLEGVALGDPGLLIADALGEEIARGERVGIIPFHAKADDPLYAEIAARIPGGEVIDVRADDPLEVVRRIASCRYVVSASLHGLITADAYGVPNTWMDSGELIGTPAFKYEDYAASIGRDIGAPVKPEAVPGHVAGTGTGPLAYAAAIEEQKAGLVAAFPAELRAG